MQNLTHQLIVCRNGSHKIKGNRVSALSTLFLCHSVKEVLLVVRLLVVELWPVVRLFGLDKDVLSLQDSHWLFDDIDNNLLFITLHWDLLVVNIGLFDEVLVGRRVRGNGMKVFVRVLISIRAIMVVSMVGCIADIVRVQVILRATWWEDFLVTVGAAGVRAFAPFAVVGAAGVGAFAPFAVVGAAGAVVFAPFVVLVV